MFQLMLILCSFSLIALGIWISKSKKPVWFWANNEDVKKDCITNIPEYNRKNGIMWMVYGALFLIPVLLKMMYPFPEWILGIFLIFISMFGAIGMMIYWEHLHDVYTS